MHVSDGRRARIITGGEVQRCAHMVHHPLLHFSPAGNLLQTSVRIPAGYHSRDGKFRAVKTRMKSGVHSVKRLKGTQEPCKRHPGSEMTRYDVSSVYFEVIMATYYFNNRHAVSPQNPNGFGKAGTSARARITVSIPGYYSMDYTRIPTSYTAQGTAWARTIGRY